MIICTILIPLLLNNFTKSDCIPSNYIKLLGFSEITIKHEYEGEQCFDIWSKNLYCLLEDESYINPIQTQFAEKNDLRMINYEIVIKYYHLLIEDKINEDNQLEILTEESQKLYPFSNDI